MPSESDSTDAADEIAQLLVDKVLRFEGFPKQLFETLKTTVDGATRSPFDAKAMAYRIATFLVFVVLEQSKDPRWALVSERVQRIVIGNDLPLRIAITEAGLRLRTLLDVSNGDPDCSLPWARAWLEDLGINEDNPIALFHFSYCWRQSFLSIANTLREFSGDILPHFQPKPLDR